MHTNELVNILGKIHTAYSGKFGKWVPETHGRELTKDFCEIWFEALEPFNAENINSGLMDYIRENENPPTVADLIRCAKKYEKHYDYNEAYSRARLNYPKPTDSPDGRYWFMELLKKYNDVDKDTIVNRIIQIVNGVDEHNCDEWEVFMQKLYIKANGGAE